MNEILTIIEVAAMLKVSKRTVCNLMGESNNPLPTLRIGRSLRFRKCDVESWLLSLSKSS